MSEEAPVLVEERKGYAILRLNRPRALNALSDALMSTLAENLRRLDARADIACMIITGNERAFAAGADIAEMKDRAFPDVWMEDFLATWDAVAACRKPLIAAVAGHALGGGCELALMCDIIIAAENARFAQPEIRLGIIPGAGGTQRLVRAIGLPKTMDMVLTGRPLTADEALAAGLVARVVPLDRLMEEAEATARTIAGFSRPAVLAAKEAVRRAAEMPLSEGLRFERRLFHALFATEDRREGMSAFLEKRRPEWKHR
jgi:enoyl-CoA hydratase